MQINHSENWKQNLINHGVAIIDLTQQSGSMIYCGEQPDSSGNFTKYKPFNTMQTYEDLRKTYENNYCSLNNNSEIITYDPPWSSPNDLRKLGWLIAVHNDYKLNGKNHTFWLMTKGNIALKGEGQTDKEALNQIREQILKGSPKLVTDKFLFSFEQKESDIRFTVYLYKSASDSERYYSLYYKFEKENCITKEISRTDVYFYDLFKYVEEMWELKSNCYSKYLELENICLSLRNES